VEQKGTCRSRANAATHLPARPHRYALPDLSIAVAGAGDPELATEECLARTRDYIINLICAASRRIADEPKDARAAPIGLEAMATGTLTVVGLGHGLAGHITAETRTCLESADRLLYLVNDPLTEAFLKTISPAATSLARFFRPGRTAAELIDDVVDAIVSPVRQEFKVCAAFSGHPAILVPPAHIAIRKAQKEGFPAQMLPAVSAPDCLYAELSVDPAAHGCAVFDATDFLIHRRFFDTASTLILLQIGSIGVTTYSARNVYRQMRLRTLTEYLCEKFPASHQVIIYETAASPVTPPTIKRLRLSNMHKYRVTTRTTLFVPPSRPAAISRVMLKKIGLAAAQLKRGRRSHHGN
jgi:uncharacterized protein YabN with tetrapyrrole methylase and pyrophosphatase domain